MGSSYTEATHLCKKPALHNNNKLSQFIRAFRVAIAPSICDASLIEGQISHKITMHSSGVSAKIKFNQWATVINHFTESRGRVVTTPEGVSLVPSIGNHVFNEEFVLILLLL
jgi:hypothetical protein